MYKLVVLLALVSFAAAQTLTKLQWSVCPGVTNVIDLLNFDATPMVKLDIHTK